MKINNLAQFFIQSANKFPHHAALVIDEITYTYQDILSAANQLAHYLSLLPGKHCALLSARGIDSYVALLAILMAGKVYVPLSIKSPHYRNLEILKFSEADLLIVDRECLPIVDDLLADYMGPLKVMTTQIAFSEPISSMMCESSNEEAYLLFTSGSTGTPKAVMTTHVSAVEYIQKMQAYYLPHEADRFSQLTDLSFDVAMHELFLCWASGACLYVISDAQLATLNRFIEQHQLTFWTSVPSTIHLLKQWNRLLPNAFSSIRYTVLLGEPLLESLVCAWHAAAPHSKIDNLYGPTEATIVFTAYRWQPDKPHPSGYVPIGYPLKNQEVAILDKNKKSVFMGEVGELYLSGSQVAKEYWRNPLMTQEKFVYLDNNKQWYKTGDYVYWDNEYGLVFKGRENDMLKIRGARVERLEVEMILQEVSETNIVSVVAESELIAFIGKSNVQNTDIIKKCREKLPNYMVPTKIIRLENLPYNKNGKVDYVRLKAYAFD